MTHKLIQIITALLGVLLLIGMASCGASTASTNTPVTSAPQSASTSPSHYPGRGSMVNGILSKIDGNQLTLTTTQGTTKVSISADTSFQKTVTDALSDLHQGESLFVMGSLDASGNIAAVSIQIQQQGWSPASPPSGGNMGTPNQHGTRTFGQRQGTVGSLASIDGNILTLTTAQGTATVNVGPDTIIQETVSGAATDLEVGQTLSVMGSSDSNGNFTATSVRIQPPGQTGQPDTPSGA